MTTIGDHRPEGAVLGRAELGSLEVSLIGFGRMAEFYASAAVRPAGSATASCRPPSAA